MITRRTEGRQFFLRPSKEVNACIMFVQSLSHNSYRSGRNSSEVHGGAFEINYKVSRMAFEAGLYDVEFPPGTYWLADLGASEAFAGTQTVVLNATNRSVRGVKR